MNTKILMSCIYLYQTHAVKSLKDKTIVDTDPVRLAKFYCDNHADRLIIFDFSSNDEEHEEALDIIKDICSQVSVDVYGSGNIHRMEDVKKLLYAGCKKVILDYEEEKNVDITQEVSLKFGKDKIFVAMDQPVFASKNLSLIETYTSGIFLMNPHQIREMAGILSSLQQDTILPLYVHSNPLALNKLIEILSSETVAGLTGNAINENAKELLSIKGLCEENGISIEKIEALMTWQDFKLNSDGMLPVVVQDVTTDEVLMVAYMNEEAYQTTLQTGKMTYFSRSRNELWIKGDTSGHYQYVKSLTADCDKDTLLAKVVQVGAACHTGKHSCFFQPVIEGEDAQQKNPLLVFEEVFDVIKDRKINPKEGSYTNYLFDKGVDKILKKLGEEATEIVIAAKNPNVNEIKYEISDFLYHMMVLMAEKNVTWEEITTELANR